MKSGYSLQRTMIVYFLLIGFACLLVSIEFIADIHKNELKEKLLSNFEKYSKNEIGAKELFLPLAKLRNKAMLMVGIILYVMIIVLTMFIKNITVPLQHMIELSGEISKGDLSRTIKIHANNELAELGNVINEMSSNLQEIILLSRNMCESGNDFAEKANATLGNNDILNSEQINNLKEEVEHLKTEIDMLSEVIEYFNFYTVEKSKLSEKES